MISRSTLQRFMLGLSVLLILLTGITASSADAANFAGKRITAIVPFSPGGGSDTLVRFLAPYFRKYLPGKPAIIVRNVPGAGSIKGANMIEKAKKNGQTFLCCSASTVMNYIMQDKRIRFKPENWIPFLNVPTGCVIYARTDLGLTGNPVEDLKKLQKKQVVFGGNSPTSGELPRLLSMYLLGLNVKPVFGLNRGPVRLGFERGEFNINYDTMAAYLQNVADLVKSNTIKPLYSFGVWDSKKNQLVRDPSVPDIPHFVEVYEGVNGKKPSGPAWDVLLGTMNAVVMNNKVLVLPAGTPKDIVETWHTAAAKVVKDKKFIKEAPKKFGVYKLNLREDAKANLLNGIKMDADSRAWLYGFLDKKYGIKKDK
jgi:tripartite-type tricarboxylate transporter receptor subunit TctC